MRGQYHAVCLNRYTRYRLYASRPGLLLRESWRQVVRHANVPFQSLRQVLSAAGYAECFSRRGASLSSRRHEYHDLPKSRRMSRAENVDY